MVHEILETEAILISNPKSEHQDIVEMLKRRISGYITAQKFVMIMYNVSNVLLDKACAITPGKRSPTVTTLDDGEYKAVSSLVLRKEVSAKMDELHQIGATDILCIELTNSLM